MRQGLVSFATFVLAIVACNNQLDAATIRGKVVNQSGNAVEGVMVSAIDAEHRKWTTVFTQEDGLFEISGLRNVDHSVRTRLMGLNDEWISKVTPGTQDMVIRTRPAVGDELEVQRPANSAFSMLAFDNPRDKMNFKMNCSYCHQVGTLGFRTPEKPVDWETMLRRMDGFGGLYPHTRETIIPRLMNTYKDDAVKKWPTFVPPPPPTGMATAATITMWEMDKPLEGSFHDLEIGRDGLVYAVNIGRGRMIALNPKTGEQTAIKFPRGAHAPHSIETANDGSLWTTMCASGTMARYDIKTKKFEVYSSAEAPKKRGNYPHTLRINPKDPEGLIWYTDAGSNSCFSMHPKTHVVKEYKLLSAGQAVGAGRGESRGITPYGLDYSPIDGMIWYSKLNGNRIGRIDPNVPDGDIKEWNPPFRGPRRLHVAPDGMVWVPGFGSGVFGKFNPKTEKWTVYDLPDAKNQIPYALNVDSKGIVWVCGTGNDTINRFDPKTETLVEFRLPTRVSYTREIEFDDDGNVWTSTSGPARHMERGVGVVIRISLPQTMPKSGGIQLVSRSYDGTHDIGNLATAPKVERKMDSERAQLYARIDANPLPEAYKKMPHQKWVDSRLAAFPKHKRSLAGSLWNEFRQTHPDRRNDGQFYVKIIDYIINNDTSVKRRFVKKWKHHNFGSAPDRLTGRSIEKGKLIFEQATCSRCHSIDGKGAKYGLDLAELTKRFQGSKLLQQIVKPSAEIHKEYQTQMILVDDGRLLTGLVIKETDEQLRLVPNLLKPDKIETIDKSSIDSRRIADISTMPTGLLDTYKVEEILDLLAYIQSAGSGNRSGSSRSGSSRSGSSRSRSSDSDAGRSGSSRSRSSDSDAGRSGSSRSGSSRSRSSGSDGNERTTGETNPRMASHLATLIQTSCIECHDATTETGLNFTQLETNFENTDSFRQWVHVFDRISKGEMPPPGETQPSKTVRGKALAFLKSELRRANQRSQRTIGRVPSRRLSRLEYEHTLHDLLGIGDDIARYLPLETQSDTFDVVAAKQDMSSVHVKGFLKAADVALDEAIQLGPKPKMVRELDYVNSRYMQMWFERPVRMGGGTVFRSENDLIMFRGLNYNLRSDQNGLRLPVAGRYRITVTGSAYQPRSSVTMSLKRQNDIQGSSELFAAWDVDEKLRTVSTIKYLRPDDYFYVSADELEPAPNGRVIYNSQPASEFKGEGVRVRKVLVEGPLESTWPPQRTRALFPGVEWEPGANGRDYKPVTTKSHYEHIRDAVAALAPRAFRRPVTENEIKDLTNLAVPGLRARRGFIASARVPLRAILVSPETLFLANETRPGESTLTDHALASRLSYFLWRSPPDEELLELARDGKLSKTRTLDAQVSRMLSDPKRDRFVHDFLGQWLELDRIDATTPDAYLYPEYDDVLRRAMLAETREFFACLVDENLSVANLVDSEFTFLNRRLAEHYGIPNVAGEEMRKVMLPTRSVRGGILTHASIAKVTANGTVTTPVKRGRFILTNLLGLPPNPPPPGVGSVEPDTRGATTIRETLKKHKSVKDCAACHRRIDPPGFAMECFDPVGNFRTRYRNSKGVERTAVVGLRFLHKDYSLGQPVDCTGQTEDGFTFNDIRDFKQHLMKSKEQVARNLVSQLITFATGAEIQFADREEVENILLATKDDGYPLGSLVHHVATNRLFRNR